MQVVRKSIKCSSREEYYVLHLNIINPLLPNKLTEKEIMILSSFMAADEKLVEDDRFNSLVRKKVMEKHKLSAGGLSNHLKAMIDKGFLRRSDVTKRIKINDFIIPGKNMQGYQFRIGYPIKGVHKGKVDETPKEKRTIKREDIKEKEKVEEKESPIDDLMPTQKEINKALAESQNNFDQAEEIIDEEEDEKPYKMKD